MNRLTAAFIPCVVALVALAGCGSDTEIRALPGPLTGGPGGPSITVPRDDPSVSQLDDATWVQVVDHGAEPHRRLRLQPKVGDVFHTQERYAFTLTVGAGGRGERLVLPPLNIDERYTVASIKGDDTTLEAEVVGGYRGNATGVDRRIKNSVDGLLRSMNGVRYIRVCGPQGTTRSTTQASNLATDGVLDELLDSYSVTSLDQHPLPLDPLGLGARWRVEHHAAQAGFRTQSLTDYELIEVTDTHATARFETTALHRPLAMATRGVLAEVTGGTTTIKGTTTWRFDRPFPIVDYTGEGILHVRVSAMGQTERADGHQRIEYSNRFTD